jgi:hypothetical protein
LLFKHFSFSWLIHPRLSSSHPLLKTPLQPYLIHQLIQRSISTSTIHPNNIRSVPTRHSFHTHFVSPLPNRSCLSLPTFTSGSILVCLSSLSPPPLFTLFTHLLLKS